MSGNILVASNPQLSTVTQSSNRIYASDPNALKIVKEDTQTNPNNAASSATTGIFQHSPSHMTHNHGQQSNSVYRIASMFTLLQQQQKQQLIHQKRQTVHKSISANAIHGTTCSSTTTTLHHFSCGHSMIMQQDMLGKDVTDKKDHEKMSAEADLSSTSAATTKTSTTKQRAEQEKEHHRKNVVSEVSHLLYFSSGGNSQGSKNGSTSGSLSCNDLNALVDNKSKFTSAKALFETLERQSRERRRASSCLPPTSRYTKVISPGPADNTTTTTLVTRTNASMKNATSTDTVGHSGAPAVPSAVSSNTSSPTYRRSSSASISTSNSSASAPSHVLVHDPPIKSPLKARQQQPTTPTSNVSALLVQSPVDCDGGDVLSSSSSSSNTNTNSNNNVLDEKLLIMNVLKNGSTLDSAINKDSTQNGLSTSRVISRPPPPVPPKPKSSPDFSGVLKVDSAILANTTANLFNYVCPRPFQSPLGAASGVNHSNKIIETKKNVSAPISGCNDGLITSNVDLAVKNRQSYPPTRNNGFHTIPTSTTQQISIVNSPSPPINRQMVAIANNTSTSTIITNARKLQDKQNLSPKKVEGVVESHHQSQSTKKNFINNASTPTTFLHSAGSSSTFTGTSTDCTSTVKRTEVCNNNSAIVTTTAMDSKISHYVKNYQKNLPSSSSTPSMNKSSNINTVSTMVHSHQQGQQQQIAQGSVLTLVGSPNLPTKAIRITSASNVSTTSCVSTVASHVINDTPKTSSNKIHNNCIATVMNSSGGSNMSNPLVIKSSPVSTIGALVSPYNNSSYVDSIGSRDDIEAKYMDDEDEEEEYEGCRSTNNIQDYYINKIKHKNDGFTTKTTNRSVSSSSSTTTTTNMMYKHLGSSAAGLDELPSPSQPLKRKIFAQCAGDSNEKIAIQDSTSDGGSSCIMLDQPFQQNQSTIYHLPKQIPLPDDRTQSHSEYVQPLWPVVASNSPDAQVPSMYEPYWRQTSWHSRKQAVINSGGGGESGGSISGANNCFSDSPVSANSIDSISISHQAGSGAKKSHHYQESTKNLNSIDPYQQKKEPSQTLASLDTVTSPETVITTTNTKSLLGNCITMASAESKDFNVKSKKTTTSVQQNMTKIGELMKNDVAEHIDSSRVDYNDMEITTSVQKTSANILLVLETVETLNQNGGTSVEDNVFSASTHVPSLEPAKEPTISSSKSSSSSSSPHQALVGDTFSNKNEPETEIHYLSDGHFWIEIPGLTESVSVNASPQGSFRYKKPSKVTFSGRAIKVYSTHSGQEYDRRNEDIDPVAASAEYELERRLEKMDLFDVEIDKSTEGLGFSIIGMGVGADAGLEKLGIFVKSVTPGGAVFRDGRINVCDQIVEVDGKSLVGVSQNYAANVLRGTSGIVRFKIGREKDLESSEIAQLIRQSIEQDRLSILSSSENLKNRLSTGEGCMPEMQESQCLLGNLPPPPRPAGWGAQRESPLPSTDSVFTHEDETPEQLVDNPHIEQLMNQLRKAFQTEPVSLADCADSGSPTAALHADINRLLSDSTIDDLGGGVNGGHVTGMGDDGKVTHFPSNGAEPNTVTVVVTSSSSSMTSLRHTSSTNNTTAANVSSASSSLMSANRSEAANTSCLNHVTVVSTKTSMTNLSDQSARENKITNILPENFNLNFLTDEHDLVDSLEATLSETKHEVDKYHVLLRESQTHYTELEKKYSKAKKLIKDYQEREKDFLEREESHLRHLLEKDKQYSSLLKHLNDKVLELEKQLSEAQRKRMSIAEATKQNGGHGPQNQNPGHHHHNTGNASFISAEQLLTDISPALAYLPSKKLVNDQNFIKHDNMPSTSNDLTHHKTSTVHIISCPSTNDIGIPYTELLDSTHAKSKSDAVKQSLIMSSRQLPSRHSIQDGDLRINTITHNSSDFLTKASTKTSPNKSCLSSPGPSAGSPMTPRRLTHFLMLRKKVVHSNREVQCSIQRLEKFERDVFQWTCDDVCRFLSSMGLEKYSPEFSINRVDGNKLLALDGAKLKSIGIQNQSDRALIKKRVKDMKCQIDKERKLLHKEQKKTSKSDKEKKKSAITS